MPFIFLFYFIFYFLKKKLVLKDNRLNYISHCIALLIPISLDYVPAVCH